MKIHHFVIHYIQKDQYRPPDLQLRDTELGVFDDDEKANQAKPLIDKFVKSASSMFDRQRSGKSYANIGKVANTFSEVFDQYLEGKTAFIDFSKRIATELFNAMKLVPLATGGYMAVAEYSSSPRRLLILMIKQEAGYAVDPKTLELRESIHLDLSTINVGARIDIDGYKKNEINHLSLVRGLKNLAIYFQNFLGVENFKSPRDETLELANVMKGYFTENSKKYPSERIEEVRRKVAELVMASKGVPIPLKTVAAFVNEKDPDDFYHYANDLGVSAEIQGDSNVTKGWIRIVLNDRKIRLDFDKALLHDSIKWDSKQDELLIDVAKFPKFAEILNQADQ